MTDNRPDRVVVDDPAPVTEKEREAARALFEERGPIANVGRRSFPRSHRGEGFNYVD